MTEDPATEPDARSRAAARRRRQVIEAGHTGDAARARLGLGDADPAVQAAAVGALARSGALTVADVRHALDGGSVPLRRAAVHHALSAGGPGSRSRLPELVITALADPDALVVVDAAWFLAERRTAAAVAPLCATVADHGDVRCREAAVAALGAIGDPSGLPAVLQALDDKATVRRRATVALAGFDDPRVDRALRRAATDRDWQVRQAAEELLDSPAG